MNRIKNEYIYSWRERGSVRMAGVSGDTRVAEPHATLFLSLSPLPFKFFRHSSSLTLPILIFLTILKLL